MDNEVEVFDGYGEGEEIVEGSYKLKDLEGEEVFEEAIKDFHDQRDVVVVDEEQCCCCCCG